MKDLRGALILCLVMASLEAASAKMTPEQVQSLPPAASRKIIFAQDIKPIIKKGRSDN
jgi:hypothetical protein